MRFRLKGTTWRVAPGLARLLTQVDEEWPARHAADGTLGNLSHSNRTSDHNPDSNGIVRAGDVGEVTEDDAFQLAEAVRLSRDSRVKYVIHERRMFSYYEKNGIAPFTWRYYSGSNGHWSHVHFSTRDIYDNDTRPWDIGGDKMPLNQMERLAVDLAFKMGAEGDPKYWYGLEPDSAEIQDLRNAINRHDHHTHGKHVGGGTVDTAARTEAAKAHARIDKLHTV